MMGGWKINIFVIAIKARLKNENSSIEELIKTYPNLKESEKQEILSCLAEDM